MGEPARSREFELVPRSKKPHGGQSETRVGLTPDRKFLEDLFLFCRREGFLVGTASEAGPRVDPQCRREFLLLFLTWLAAGPYFSAQA